MTHGPASYTACPCISPSCLAHGAVSGRGVMSSFMYSECLSILQRGTEMDAQKESLPASTHWCPRIRVR